LHENLDSVNLDYNHFPSLHVAFACSMAWEYGRKRSWLIRSGYLIWAGLIAVSTLLCAAHYAVDVLGGFALAAYAMGILRPRFSKRPRLIYVELACLFEFAHFIKRSLRYASICILLYLPALSFSRTNRRTGRQLRVAYAFAQHLDDVLDLDRRVSHPLEHASGLMQFFLGEKNRPATGPEHLACFTGALLRGLKQTPQGVYPAQLFMTLFKCLAFDFERARDRRMIPEAILKDHHKKTFESSLALVLALTDSKIKIEELSPLVEAFCWVSPVRDLAADASRGLINVPYEYLDQANRDALKEGGRLAFDTRLMQDWLRKEYMAGASAMTEFKRRFPERPPDPAGWTIWFLYLALEEYAKRYARRHGDWLKES
jgi:hypothetical protein